MHELLFAAEDTDVDPYFSQHGLDRSTTFILDVETLMNAPNIETICVNSYIKTNNKDMDLDSKSDLCQFLLSIHDKTNIGIHVITLVKLLISVKGSKTTPDQPSMADQAHFMGVLR